MRVNDKAIIGAEHLSVFEPKQTLDVGVLFESLNGVLLTVKED
jgi:hypothetical protein